MDYQVNRGFEHFTLPYTLVALRHEQAQLREFVKTASAGGQPTDTASETVESDAQDEGQILMVEL